MSKYDHDGRDFYLAMADDDDGDDQGQDDEGGENPDGDHRACVHRPILLPVEGAASLYVPERCNWDQSCFNFLYSCSLCLKLRSVIMSEIMKFP